MNPWSRAEEEASEGESSPDAAQERELFAGRLRAMARDGEGFDVPSLGAVLREAQAQAQTQARESKVARLERRPGAREAVAVVMAAACLMAAFTRLPRESGHAGIGPDIDAAAIAPRTSPLLEHVAAATCGETEEVADTCASREDLCTSPQAVVSPSPSPAPAPATPPVSMSVAPVSPAPPVDSQSTSACESEDPASTNASYAVCP